MSIRLRLVLSYTAMIFVPVLLFILSLIILVLLFMGDILGIADYYNVKLKENGIEKYFSDRSLTEAELKHTSMFEPDRLLNSSYMSMYEDKLAELKMAVIVRKKDELAYTWPVFKGEHNAQLLPSFPSKDYTVKHDHEAMKRTLIIDDFYYSFSQYDFYFSDKSEGSLFILTDITPFKDLSQKFNPALALWGAFLLALILTNGMLTFFVSRSILKPLRELRQAADHIKEGHLDFALSTKRNDELGQLSKAFEEMRIKLKESIEIRLQTEENRKELISNISHDLKTPITGIIGYIEGLRDGVAAEPEKREKYMNTIFTKAKGLDQLIDELFLYSKLDLDSVPFNYEQVSIVSFIQDCINHLKLDLEKQDIQLVWENHGVPETLMVQIDGEKLKRVIINIIENSCRFMDKQPAIVSVRTKQSADYITIDIEDNGAGIEQADLPHIFERFYRADKSRNPNQGGSGLGLAIAKQIIEAHDGTIQAESKLGEGTLISVGLPIK
jgi:histidine kinase